MMADVAAMVEVNGITLDIVALVKVNGITLDIDNHRQVVNILLKGNIASNNLQHSTKLY